jgi:hypothetical protein
MSVGDVIVDEAGKAWIVASFGFHTLNGKEEHEHA